MATGMAVEGGRSLAHDHDEHVGRLEPETRLGHLVVVRDHLEEVALAQPDCIVVSIAPRGGMQGDAHVSLTRKSLTGI